MPSLKAIRNRIGSVKNTQKITRAMKLVAAARLRRAQETLVAARPYARALEEAIAEVATRAGADAHPMFEARPVGRVELIVISADRGLAGAYNSQINRAVDRYSYENKGSQEISLTIVGRKAREYLKRRNMNVSREHGGVTSQTAAARARELASQAVERFLKKEVDAVFLVYNEFKSAVTQKVQVEQLLPVKPRPLPAGASPTDYVYEPDRATVLANILPMYVEVEIMRALLESIASFFGAQMTSMENATKNASEMIGRLTLVYNRARQAAITKELLEIIGGAEALKG